MFFLAKTCHDPSHWLSGSFKSEFSCTICGTIRIPASALESQETISRDNLDVDATTGPYAQPGNADMDLAYLGRQEGEYVLEVSKDSLRHIQDTVWIIEQEEVTRASFISSFGHESDSRSRSTAWSIIKTYENLFETLVKNLGPTFTEFSECPLRHRLPTIASWMLDCANYENKTAKRDWRNICAHRALVRPPFAHHSTNEMRTQPFLPGKFFDENMGCLPPLKVVLKDLVTIPNSTSRTS